MSLVADVQSSACAHSTLLLTTVPSLDNTFGAVLLGTCAGLVLFGLTVHQSYRYFRMYPQDSSVLKIMVALLVLLETFHTALCIHMCYYYLTENYFHPIALLNGVWSLRLLPVVTGTLIFVCHGFYARRIYLMGQQYRIIVSFVIFFMIGELAFVIASTIEAFIQISIAKWANYTWLISTGFGFAVSADAALTCTLIYILRGSRTGFTATDSLIDVLIVYTINTGLLTGLFSILSLVFAVAYPKNLIYVSFNMISTRTYANSVLAVLNSRRSLNDRCAFGVGNAGSFGMCAFEKTCSTAMGTAEEACFQVRRPVFDIKINNETTFARDTSQRHTSDVEIKDDV